MLTFKNLSPVLKSVDFDHPIFKAYQIEKVRLSETQTVLFAEHLVLLIVDDLRNETVGMVKWLKETRHLDASKEHYVVHGKTYRVAANLALLTREQEKEFDKTYRHSLKQLRKAIKDYQTWCKKTQKQAIKVARQVENPITD